MVQPAIVTCPFTLSLASGGLVGPLPLLDTDLLLQGNDAIQVAANLFYFVRGAFLLESRMLGPFKSNGHISHEESIQKLGYCEGPIDKNLS